MIFKDAETLLFFTANAFFLGLVYLEPRVLAMLQSLVNVLLGLNGAMLAFLG